MADDTEKIVEQNRQVVAMTRMVRVALAFEPEETRKALRELCDQLDEISAAAKQGLMADN